MNLPWMILAVVLAFAGGTLLGEWDGRSRANAQWETKAQKSRADAVSSARVKETALFRNMEVAYRANQQENQKLRAAADHARRASLGLRDDLATVRRHLAGDTGAASHAALAACHAVLGSCSERYPVAVMAADKQALLGVTTQVVKFSDYDAIKQAYSRMGDVNFTVSAYRAVQGIMDDAELIVRETGQMTVWFRRDGRLMVGVIAQTQTGKGIYLKSLRFGSEADKRRSTAAGSEVYRK